MLQKETEKYKLCTFSDIIPLQISVLLQSLNSPQVKGYLISSIVNSVFELPIKLPHGLRLRTFLLSEN